MKIFSYLLFAVASASVCAVHAAPSSKVVADAQLQQKLLDVLRNMVKTGSDDFYDAAVLVLDATGDESAFLPMMEKAAAAGSSAAQYWLVVQRLPFVEPGTKEFSDVMLLLNKAVKGKYSPALILSAQVKAQSGDTNGALADLMEACRLGNPKARAIYLMQTGRLASGNYELPEIASELKKKNYYLEEIIASMQTSEQAAYEWMRRAKEHGSNTAPCILSQIPERTAAEALPDLKLAAERHNVMALYMYGLVCYQGSALESEFTDNPVEAKRLLQLAAMLGSPEACCTLAEFYAIGNFDGVSPERIYKLFEYAARYGLPNGVAGVGFCKVLGAGCKADVELGLKLMMSARDKGAQWVNRALASLYFNGCAGIKPDLRKALDFLSEDAVQGGVFSYSIAAGIAAVGTSENSPDTSMAEYYLNSALSIPEIAAESRRMYDIIVTTKEWYFMPVLEKSVK